MTENKWLTLLVFMSLLGAGVTLFTTSNHTDAASMCLLFAILCLFVEW